MDSTFQLELIDTIKKLSKKLKELKINHDFLNDIQHKLTNVLNKDNVFNDVRQLNKSDCSSFCESDNNLTVNYISAASRSHTNELYSDALDDICPELSGLNIINSNCSEDLLNFRFAEEDWHCVIEEETIETPFFKLKHTDRVYYERMENISEFMDAFETVILVGGYEIYECVIIECSDIEEWNILKMSYCNVRPTCNDPIYYCHYIITIDSRTITNAPFGRISPSFAETIQIDGRTYDQGYLITICNTLKYVNLFQAENDFDAEVAEISCNQNDLFYTSNDISENYMPHIRIVDDISKTSLRIYRSYSSSQSYRHSTELIKTKLPFKFSRLKVFITKSVELYRIDLITEPTLLLTMKRRYLAFYKRYCGSVTEGMKEGDVADLDFRFQIKNKNLPSVSTNKRKLTFSEKRWHILLKASLLAIYRKITSSMFKSDTDSQTTLVSLEMANDLTNSLQDTSHSIVGKTSKGNLYYKSTVAPLIHAAGCIKLNSINIIENRISDFNMSQIQNCKNVFDIKKAIKANLMKDSTDETNNTYFSDIQTEKNRESDVVTCHKCISSEDVESDSSDTIKLSPETSVTLVRRNLKCKHNRSTSKELSELDCENMSFDYTPTKILPIESFPRSRQTGHHSLRQCFSSISNKRLLEDENQTATSESLGACDSDYVVCDSRRSRSYSSSEFKNRFTKTSKQTTNDTIAEESIANDENSQSVSSLRKKAVTCIENAKNSKDLDQRKRISLLSENIDKFFGNQNSVRKKNYYCSECRMSFKLGTELRQHKRGHNFH